MKKKRNIQKLVTGGPVDPDFMDLTKLTPEQLTQYQALTDDASKLAFMKSLKGTTSTLKTPLAKGLATTDSTKNTNGAGYAAAGNMLGSAVEQTVPDNNKGNMGRTVAADTLKGAGTGAAIGSVIPVIGTAIGAVAGTVVGATVGIVTGSNKRSKARSENMSSAFESNQNSYLAKQQAFNNPTIQSFNKGGKIKGKGTSKSDSIPAKLSKKGFVIPAENATLAKRIAMMHLGHKENQMAKLKEGGTPVKVSDQEYYFTPEETKKLTLMGIDLNKLAPNSTSGNKLKSGGPVDYNYKGSTYKVVYDDNGKVTSIVDASGKDITSSDIGKGITRLFRLSGDNSIEQTAAQIKAAKSGYSVAAPKGTEATGVSKDGVITYSDGTKKDAKTGAVITTPITTTTTAAKIIENSTVQDASTVADATKLQLAVDYNNGQMDWDSYQKQLKEVDAKQTLDANDPTIDKTTTDPLTTTAKANRKFGLAEGLGLVQTGLGAAALLSDGKPPEYNIDPEIMADAHRARLQAGYGLEGNDVDLAQKSIEAARRMRIQNIANFSAGSGSTALANIQKTDLSSNESMSKLASYDTAAKSTKEKYADTLDARVAAMRRQKFTDKLALWQQNEKAGAALLQAGISNVIGASKYKDMLDREAERNALDNQQLFPTV